MAYNLAQVHHAASFDLTEMNASEVPFPARIREYEILEMLGQGGMGAVYRARHIYLQEERAIKLIRGQYAENQNIVQRFIREARMLTKLRHPNLVQLYEFGELDQGTFFMVLEFIHGESLLQRIRSMKRIPVTDCIRIIREAAQGLESAHQEGVIHRDISPDNLMLVKINAGEITKVIDFGIAKPLFEGTQHFSVTHMFIGKPEYCSPEQCGILEEGETIDHRSDIYSLAVTLYHMLSGRTPFYSTTPQGYILKHVAEPPKPVSAHLPAGEIPPALDQLILKALSKNRNDRPSSMNEFIRELNECERRLTLPEPAGKELQPGELFAGRYLIEKKIGQGGMGVVYKAVDQMLNVPVALKTMKHHIIEDAETLQRFKHEVILARKVGHPNIRRIFDIGESDGVHYVTMEFLEGKTLSDILRAERRLSPLNGIQIIIQLLQALDEAHRVGVIHRDLKPQNIIIDSGRRAYIMDFGISISNEMERLTRTGYVVGTPQYMAPEQFQERNIDHRADIYSIGVILFEIFTGKLPFEGSTPIAIISAHLNSTPPRPSEFERDISADLDRVILKTLEKDPGKRYQNVRELLRDLIKATATFAAVPIPVGVPPKEVPKIPEFQGVQSVSQTHKPQVIPPPPPAFNFFSASQSAEVTTKKEVNGLLRLILVMGIIFGAAMIVFLLRG